MTDYARFRERFAQAMDQRLYSIEYLDSLLFTGKAQIWFGERAAIVTEVREYPTGARVIHGLVAAGAPGSSPGQALAEIIETLIPRAEEWGRSIGCVLAVVESRAGWARQLRSQGYEPHQVTLRKALQPAAGPPAEKITGRTVSRPARLPEGPPSATIR